MRIGKPMRPDVALAFDRMAAAARSDGVSLIVNSGYRSDAEQASSMHATLTRNGWRRSASRCIASAPSSTWARQPRTPGSRATRAAFTLFKRVQLGSLAL